MEQNLKKCVVNTVSIIATITTIIMVMTMAKREGRKKAIRKS